MTFSMCVIIFFLFQAYQSHRVLFPLLSLLGGTLRGPAMCHCLLHISFLCHDKVPPLPNIYICVCVYIYVYIHICTYIHIHIHICVYTYIYTHICTYTYTHTYIHICVYTHMYVYIYTYTHTHTHTYTHKLLLASFY